MYSPTALITIHTVGQPIPPRMYQELFHLPLLKFCALQAVNSRILFPQLLETSLLLSVPLKLMTLGTSYKQNHVISVLL